MTRNRRTLRLFFSHTSLTVVWIEDHQDMDGPFSVRLSRESRCLFSQTQSLRPDKQCSYFSLQFHSCRKHNLNKDLNWRGRRSRVIVFAASGQTAPRRAFHSDQCHCICTDLTQEKTWEKGISWTSRQWDTSRQLHETTSRRRFALFSNKSDRLMSQDKMWIRVINNRQRSEQKT